MDVHFEEDARPERLKLLILDDQALFRAGIGRALSMEPGMLVVAECESVSAAVAFVENHPVDVVLLDLDLPEEAGQEFLARTIAGHRPKVLVVAGAISEFQVRLLMRAGVDGMVLKNESLPVLCEAIRHVAAGRTAFDSPWLRLILDRKRLRHAGLRPFTLREREVLQGVLEGLSSKEIAHKVLSTEAAVKSVIQQLFQKTGTRSRAQLVRLAIESGTLGEGLSVADVGHTE